MPVKSLLTRTAAIMPLLASFSASSALANVTGSVTVQNPQTGVTPGAISLTQCQTSAFNCNMPPYVTAGGSTAGTVVSTTQTGTGQSYGLLNLYLTYSAPPLNQGNNTSTVPQCTWYVQVSSNSSASWSGKVSAISSGDALYNNGAGYNPVCQDPSFSVNGTTGNWSLTAKWAQ